MWKASMNHYFSFVERKGIVTEMVGAGAVEAWAGTGWSVSVVPMKRTTV